MVWRYQFIIWSVQIRRMEKELTNFKNWFKNLDFETNDKIDDNVLKKYATYSRINTNRTYDFDFALLTYS